MSCPSSPRRFASSSPKSGSSSTRRSSPGCWRSSPTIDERGGSPTERHAYILDFLPNGRQTGHGYLREPVALALGETELKLLEILPRPGGRFAAGERVGLVATPGGADPRIDHVRRRLGYDELTATARGELLEALARVVLADPPRYLRFFNESHSVSRRFNLLELLPGIGKKTMRAIVEERQKAPFSSFQDLSERMHLKNPERLVAARMEQELSGVEDQYRLFVAP